MIDSIPAPAQRAPAPPPVEGGGKTFRVGTLVYTRAGLFTLFAWLLWGDVCFVLMEAVPGLIPLKLKALDTPNWLMSLILSTIPMLLNATICPWVSFKSDRHRGPRGRRMPFILYTAPFLAVALAAIGFSHPLAHALGEGLAALRVAVSPNTAELIVIMIFSALFAFFNMFVGSLFWYLFRDLVPEVVLSRFFSLMRMISTGAVAFYNFIIFPHATDYMPWIFLGGAVLYFTTFTVLCLKVKEGQYPPPPETGAGAFSGIKTYGKECFSHHFYWLYYLYGGFNNIAISINMFALFLQLQMGLTLAQIGTLGGIGGIWTLVLMYFGGTLADRFHPIRTALLANVVTAVLFTPFGILWLFYNPTPQIYYYVCLVSNSLWVPFGVLSAVSAQPLEMRIFPQALYGQFCSANALIRSVLVIVAGPVAGGFIDLIKKIYHGSDYAYRYIAVWQVVFVGIGTFFFILLYREWKRLGGDESYVPPEVEGLAATI